MAQQKQFYLVSDFYFLSYHPKKGIRSARKWIYSYSSGKANFDDNVNFTL